MKASFSARVIDVMIEMSKRQAQDFARSIVADIAEYCSAHEMEFKEFLANEVQNDAN